MGQLPQIRPNPVKILAGAGFGRISKKGPDLPEPEPKSGTSLSAVILIALGRLA